MKHQKREWKFFTILKYYIISLLENIWKKLEIQKATQTQPMNSNPGKNNSVSDSAQDFTVTNLSLASIFFFKSSRSILNLNYV